MKKYLLLLIMLFALGVQAQKSRAQLSAEIAGNLPDNNSQQITAALLRLVLNDMVTSSRNVVDDGSQLLNYPVPADSDTIFVTPTQHITTITFQDSLTADFTLNIGDTSACHVGDMIFLVIQNNGLSVNVNFTGNIINVMCGNPASSFATHAFINVIPFIFDGHKFRGIDNC